MSAETAGTDRSFLRNDQYRDERNLEARRAIYAHAVEGGDFISPAVEALGDATSVLDVGCGPGMWHEIPDRHQAGTAVDRRRPFHRHGERGSRSGPLAGVRR